MGRSLGVLRASPTAVVAASVPLVAHVVAFLSHLAGWPTGRAPW